MIWEVLEWFFGILGVYIGSIIVIAYLALKHPILEKVAVEGLRLLPVISKIIGKSLLNKMCDKIGITKDNIEIPTPTIYPSLIFNFELDSKAPIKFTPIELTAYVYLEKVFMGKINWTKNEKCEIKKKEIINFSIVPDLEVDEVPDLEAMGKSKIRLNFTPPLVIFKPRYFANKPYSHGWRLETVITFSTRLGNVSKRFSKDFLVDKDRLLEISKHFACELRSESK